MATLAPECLIKPDGDGMPASPDFGTKTCNGQGLDSLPKAIKAALAAQSDRTPSALLGVLNEFFDFRSDGFVLVASGRHGETRCISTPNLDAKTETILGAVLARLQRKKQLCSNNDAGVDQAATDSSTTPTKVLQAAFVPQLHSAPRSLKRKASPTPEPEIDFNTVDLDRSVGDHDTVSVNDASPCAELKHVTAADVAKLHAFYESKFKQMTQIACKEVAKAWIKCVDDKKQGTHPYNGGKKARQKGLSKEQGSVMARPNWWPPVDRCRHTEPDHLKKEERVYLLLWILVRLAHPDQELKPGLKLNVEQLRLSTNKIFDKLSSLNNGAEVVSCLNEIYQIREFEERSFQHEIDGNATTPLQLYVEKKRMVSRRGKAVGVGIETSAGSTAQTTATDNEHGSTGAASDAMSSFETPLTARPSEPFGSETSSFSNNRRSIKRPRPMRLASKPLSAHDLVMELSSHASSPHGHTSSQVSPLHGGPSSMAAPHPGPSPPASAPSTRRCSTMIGPGPIEVRTTPNSPQHFRHPMNVSWSSSTHMDDVPSPSWDFMGPGGYPMPAGSSVSGLPTPSDTTAMREPTHSANTSFGTYYDYDLTGSPYATSAGFVPTDLLPVQDAGPTPAGFCPPFPPMPNQQPFLPADEVFPLVQPSRLIAQPPLI